MYPPTCVHTHARVQNICMCMYILYPPTCVHTHARVQNICMCMYIMYPPTCVQNICMCMYIMYPPTCVHTHARVQNISLLKPPHPQLLEVRNSSASTSAPVFSNLPSQVIKQSDLSGKAGMNGIPVLF